VNLRLLIHGLPEVNKSLCFYLSAYLREVAQNSAHNKMDTDNLAMVFAPNLLRTEKDDVTTLMNDQLTIKTILRMSQGGRKRGGECRGG
jgi:hypothetical protein